MEYQYALKKEMTEDDSRGTFSQFMRACYDL